MTEVFGCSILLRNGEAVTKVQEFFFENRTERDTFFNEAQKKGHLPHFVSELRTVSLEDAIASI